MIDPHVHLRDWNLKAKDTLAHGLLTAARAGFTHLFDMPNTSPPLTSRALIEKRLAEARAVCRSIEAAEGRRIRYSLYAGLTGSMAQVREVAGAAAELFPGVIGLKLFAGHSTGNMGLVDAEERDSVFKTLVGCGYKGVVAVHCEKQEIINRVKLIACEKQELISSEYAADNHLLDHFNNRPPEAECVSVEEQIQLASKAGFRGSLHICHVSNPESVDCIERYRPTVPFLLTCGITPHHLLLDVDTDDPEKLMKVNPPVRTAAMREKLFTALLSGRIDWIESDHAPHELKAKKSGASGIPGFSGYLLLVEMLRREGLDEERIAELTSGSVEKAFNLQPEYGVLPDRDEFLHKFSATAREYPADPYQRFYTDLIAPGF